MKFAGSIPLTLAFTFSPGCGTDEKDPPDGQNSVQIFVEGPADLIGYDNGNPVDHTSIKKNTRQVFNGLALAVIQSRPTSGAIKVRAVSGGLREGVIEITAQKSTAAIPTVEDIRNQ
jgi:hypothetical protein